MTRLPPMPTHVSPIGPGRLLAASPKIVLWAHHGEMSVLWRLAMYHRGDGGLFVVAYERFAGVDADRPYYTKYVAADADLDRATKGFAILLNDAMAQKPEDR